MYPKLSIVIPVYNSEKYLKRCFDSILMNNYPNLEIVVVNDGSQDSSQQIIDEYYNKYPKIFVVIKQNNQGIGKARNNGLIKATGEYIFFIDNDDFIDDDYIKTYLDAIQIKQSDIIISGYKRSTEDKVLFSINLKEKPWSKFVNIAPWAKIYRRQFLIDNDIRFLNSPIFEDVYFNLQAFTLSNKISVIEYTGYNWYYNNTSVSNTIHEKFGRIDYIGLLNEFYGVLEEKHAVNDRNKDIIEVYFTILIVQFLKWISYKVEYNYITIKYNELFTWLKEHFPNYKKAKYWRITKGDRLKVRLILLMFMTCHKIHLGKLIVYLYGRI